MRLLRWLQRIPRVSRAVLFHEPCDWWVGFYYSKVSRALYFCPLPTIGIRFDLDRPGHPR